MIQLIRQSSAHVHTRTHLSVSLSLSLGLGTGHLQGLPNLMTTRYFLEGGAGLGDFEN